MNPRLVIDDPVRAEGVGHSGPISLGSCLEPLRSLEIGKNAGTGIDGTGRTAHHVHGKLVDHFRWFYGAGPRNAGARVGGICVVIDAEFCGFSVPWLAVVELYARP